MFKSQNLKDNLPPQSPIYHEVVSPPLLCSRLHRGIRPPKFGVPCRPGPLTWRSHFCCPASREIPGTTSSLSPDYAPTMAMANFPHLHTRRRAVAAIRLRLFSFSDT